MCIKQWCPHKPWWSIGKHEVIFPACVASGFAIMARGHQKIQSQQKNAKKQAEMKKAKGHDQKTAAKAALVFTCLVCRVSIRIRHFTFFFSSCCSFDFFFLNICMKSLRFLRDNEMIMLVLFCLKYFCSSFLQSQMPDPKTFKQHFESKHPKSPLPPELEGVEA